MEIALNKIKKNIKKNYFELFFCPQLIVQWMYITKNIDWHMGMADSTSLWFIVIIEEKWMNFGITSGLPSRSSIFSTL
jgi:hypothetical protein